MATLTIDLSYYHKRAMFSAKALSSSKTFLSKKQDRSDYALKFMRDVLDAIMFAPHYTKVIGVRDSSTWRKDTYPDYKKRESNDDVDWAVFREMKKQLDAHLNSKGMPIAYTDRLEADDLMFTISKVTEEALCISSSDKDMHQLVRAGSVPVYCHNPLQRKLYSHKDNNVEGDLFELVFSGKAINDPFSEAYRRFGSTVEYIDPERVLIEKLLQGDAGDNIKNIAPKIGEKTAEKICDRYFQKNPNGLDLNILYESAHSISKNVTEQSMQNLELNVKLIRLCEDSYPDGLYASGIKEAQRVTRLNFDKEPFKTLDSLSQGFKLS